MSESNGRRVMRLCVSTILAIALVGFIGAETSAAEPREPSPCKLYNEMMDARDNFDRLSGALNKAQISPELESKVIGIAISKTQSLSLKELSEMTIEKAYQLVADQLDFSDKAQIASYIAAKAALTAAESAATKANDAYTAELAAADADLAKAQAKFEEEQSWLEQEKAAIESMPRDDAYLDRVSKVTQRLKAAYEQMKQDLAAHSPCAPNVASFLRDKDERLKRIAALDAEIARRRGMAGGKPGDVTTTGNTTSSGATVNGTTAAGASGAAEESANITGEPLGDTYVCAGPEITPNGKLTGTLTSASASGLDFYIMDGENKITGKVTITKGPPLKVRVNQVIDLQMKAEGDAYAYGNFIFNNVLGGVKPENFDNGAASKPGFKSEGVQDTGRAKFQFNPAENPYIQFYGGHFNSRDGTEVNIYWKYKKE